MRADTSYIIPLPPNCAVILCWAEGGGLIRRGGTYESPTSFSLISNGCKAMGKKKNPQTQSPDILYDVLCV